MGLTRMVLRRDEQQLQRLHQLGMKVAEEAKLMAMRDHISKLTDSKASG